MHKTAQRNGVLFYLAVEDHKFAILGDAGINQLVPDHFWDDIKDEMLVHFKTRQFTEGLCIGIGMAARSEEHTSELQSRPHLVCRLLLEKKNIGHADIEQR